MKAEFVMVKGRRIGESVTLAAASRLVFGTDPGCEVALSDGGLAPFHFMVEERAGTYLLCDLDSEKGIFLNGERVISRELAHGDRVQAGESEWVFSCKDTAVQPPPVRFLDTREEVQKRIDVRAAAFLRAPRNRDVARYVRIIKSLSTVYKVGNAIAGERDISRLFSLVVDALLKAVKAERAALILADEEGGLDPVVVRVPRGREGLDPLTISRTIVRETIRSGHAVLCSDASHDARFRAGDSVISCGIKSVLCAPLVAQRRVLGVIYLDTVSATTAFSEHDLELVSAVGKQAGIAVERSLLEEESLRVRRYAEAVLNGAPVGIAAFDLDGLVKQWGRYCERAFGWTAEETVGKRSLRDLFPGKPGLTHVLEAVMREGVYEGEVVGRIRSGKDRPFLFSLARLTDVEGHHIGFTGTFLDLSGRREVRDALVDEERRAGLGMLAAGLANDLVDVAGVLTELGRLAETDAERRGALPRLVQEQAARVGRVARHILAFARQRADRTEMADVREVIGGVVAVLGAEFDRVGVRLEQRMNPVPRTSLCVGMVEEAFLHLLLRTREMVGRGGAVIIGLTAEPASAPEAVIVRIGGVGGEKGTVAGRGTVGAGIGLGLNLVRRIVEGHAGTVTVEEDVELGTMFVVRLPIRVADAAVVPREAPGEAAGASGASGASPSAKRVLVVGDDPFIADIVAEVLAGHDVRAVHDGGEAIDLVSRERFDLVLLDVLMPGRVDGYQTFKSLKGCEGAPRIVVVTGQTTDRRVKEVLCEADGCLRKPLDVKEIVGFLQ